MIITAASLAQLEATTPPTAEVQERVRSYMGTAQLTAADLAHRINYGKNSLNLFLQGKYISLGISKTDVRIRRALVDFMDAHPVEIQTEAEGKLYETSNVALMREWFARCLRNREMAFVYGPPGAQKTFVFSHLVAEHNHREIAKNGHGTRAYYVYCSEGIRPRDLLRKMCRAAGIPAALYTLNLIDNLRFHLHARKSLFILDEAQHLTIPTLEIVRELNDCPPHCGVLLAGSHRLLATFKDRAAELEQWNSRISKGVELPGITVPEAVAILGEELPGTSTLQVKQFIESCKVVDGYSPKREKYISARRLFRQISHVKSDPRYFAPTSGGNQ